MNTFATMIPLLISNLSQANIIEIIDSSEDGTGHVTDEVRLNVDAQGNIYLTGTNTDNLFRISASSSCTTAICDIVEALDANGDGLITHDRTSAVAFDAAGNVYLTGQFSDNVWRILNPVNCGPGGTPCNIEEIIGTSGNGVSPLQNPETVSVVDEGNVYVAGASSNHVFRIAASNTCGTGGGPLCITTEIIDDTGDGSNVMTQPLELAIDRQNNVFFTTQVSDNVFKIATPGSCSYGGSACTITEIIDDSNLTAGAFGQGIVVDS
jgi:hypothetical protein